MSRAAWSQFKPPDWVDPEAFLFFGADPSWTPAKEGLASAPPPGECPHCRGRGCFAQDSGGHLIRDEHGEPVFLRGAIEDGSHAVCPRCRRYGLDRLLDRAPPPAAMRGQSRPETRDVGDDHGDESPKGDARPGKIDLTGLSSTAPPTPAPGFVTKVVAAGSITVPERFAHLLNSDGR